MGNKNELCEGCLRITCSDRGDKRFNGPFNYCAEKAGPCVEPEPRPYYLCIICGDWIRSNEAFSHAIECKKPEPVKFEYKQAEGKVFCNNCKEWVNDIDADAHVKGCWVCGKLIPITAPDEPVPSHVRVHLPTDEPDRYADHSVPPEPQPKLICFRCGEAITDGLYVHTLSNEYAHPYCQARGSRKLVEPPKPQGIVLTEPKRERFFTDLYFDAWQNAWIQYQEQANTQLQPLLAQQAREILGIIEAKIEANKKSDNMPVLWNYQFTTLKSKYEEK
jgi:hypothetical protein